MNASSVHDGGEIWVLSLADETGEDEDRGAVLDRIAGRYQRTRLSAEQLRDNLGGFLDSLEPVVQRIPAVLGGFGVDTVALSAEINAKGTVSLVGTGGEVGAKGGITITLKRRA
jgi:hypothetical protein